MPYIAQPERERLSRGSVPDNPGELNFAVTRLIDEYLHRRGGLRYVHINEVVGVLECAKLELYRRIAAPYEEHKRDEHGDVYTASP